MAHKIDSPAQLHSEHRQWANEILAWRDDIASWRKQHKQALIALEHIAEMIRKRDSGLDNHAELLDKIEASLESHEKNLAKSLSDHAGADLDNALVERHAVEKAQFELQQGNHKRIKHHHHNAMAQLAALTTVLDEFDSFDS